MANLKRIAVTQNDSLPSLEYTVSRSGTNSTTPDLSGYTATLKVRLSTGTTNSFSLAVTSSGGTPGQITNTSAAVVRFDFTTTSWASTGTFLGEVSFTSSGKTETAPDRQLFTVQPEF